VVVADRVEQRAAHQRREGDADGLGPRHQAERLAQPRGVAAVGGGGLVGRRERDLGDGDDRDRQHRGGQAGGEPDREVAGGEDQRRQRQDAGDAEPADRPQRPPLQRQHQRAVDHVGEADLELRQPQLVGEVHGEQRVHLGVGQREHHRGDQQVSIGG
jgi:hypothetical protein